MEARKNENELLDLPEELLTMMGQILIQESPKAAANFSSTSKRLLSIMNFALKLELNHKLFPKLRKYVKERNLDKLKALIERNPYLLCCKTTFIDKTGREIFGTIFQYALGAVDIEMLEILEPRFDKIKNGHQKKAKQYYEQFPDDYDKNASDRYFYDDFRKIIDALNYDPLTNGKMNENTAELIQKFHQFVIENQIITEGEHFDIRLYINAMVYSVMLKDDARQSIYCRKVLGFLQRYLTSYDAVYLCSQFMVEGEKTNEYLSKGLLKDGSDYFSQALGVTQFNFEAQAQTPNKIENQTIRISTERKNATDLYAMKDEYLKELKKRIQNPPTNDEQHEDIIPVAAAVNASDNPHGPENSVDDNLTPKPGCRSSDD